MLKSIEVQHSSGQKVLLYASKSYQLSLHSLNAKVSVGVEHVLIVCELLDLFPKDLLRMPPKRIYNLLLSSYLAPL